MERLNDTQKNGISRTALRTWGLVFMGLGVFGKSILQNRLLGMGSGSGTQLLQKMMESDALMAYATLAVILEAVSTCAAPIFCFLLVEGFMNTKDFKKYLLRVAGAACIAELPYNLAMSGRLLDTGSRNPMFAMVLCLVMLYLYDRFAEKSTANTVIRLVVTVAALVWSGMLGIESGIPCVLIVAVLWMSRKLENYRNFIGCAAAAVCSVFSVYYIAAPMGFMAVHFYKGEQRNENRIMNYLMYPALLLVVGLAGMFLI